jgi:mRNA interferase MazF
MHRGEIWWASLPAPAGSGPGYRRPVLVVQSEEFNESRIQTVLVAAITSNVRLAAAPGNVLCARRDTGLPRTSVIKVSQVLTVDKRLLTERISALPPRLLRQVEDGLRLILAL